MSTALQQGEAAELRDATPATIVQVFLHAQAANDHALHQLQRYFGLPGGDVSGRVPPPINALMAIAASAPATPPLTSCRASPGWPVAAGILTPRTLSLAASPAAASEVGIDYHMVPV